MIKHIMTRAFIGYDFVIPDAAEAEIKRRIETAKADLSEMAKWKPYRLATVDIDDFVGDTMQFPVLYDNGRFASQGAVTTAYAEAFWKSYCNPTIWGSVKYDKVDGTFDVAVFLSYDAHPEHIGSEPAIVEPLNELFESDEPMATTVGKLKLEFGLSPDGMYTLADMLTYGVDTVDPDSCGVDYIGRQEFDVDVAPEDCDYAYWALTSYLGALREHCIVMNFNNFNIEGMLCSAFGKMQEFAHDVGENPPSEVTTMEVKFDGRYAGTYFKLTFIPTSNNK